MFKTILSIFLLISLVSCRSNQDEAFKLYSASFQEQMDQEQLFHALLEKRLSFDSILVQPKTETLRKVLKISKERLEELNLFKTECLTPELHSQYQNTQSLLTSLIKHIETDKIFETKPEFYSPLPYLKAISIAGNKNQILDGLDAIFNNYQFAIHHLTTNDSLALENGVQNGKATFDFLSNEILSKIKSMELEETEKLIFLRKLAKARLGVKNYIAFCNSMIFELKN